MPLGLVIVKTKEQTIRDESLVKVVVDKPTHGSMVEINGKSLKFKVRDNKDKKKTKETYKVNLFVPINLLGSSSKRNPNSI